MSLIRKQTIIGLCCASHLLNVDESTIRKGLLGTDALTLMRLGNGKRQKINLILEEVIDLKAKWISDAQKKGSKGKLTLVA